MEGEFGKVEIVVAAQQVVFVLDRLHPRQADFVRLAQVLHGAPGGLVGEPEVADLALTHELAHLDMHVEDVGQHLVAVLLVGVVVPRAFPVVVPAARPVDLVEVDVVGLQAPQAPFHRLAHRGGVDAAAAAHPWAAAAGDLGREDHPGAVAGLSEPGADDLLGLAVGGGRGGHGVHFGGIEEVDAVVERVVHLRVTFGFGVLQAPGHGAEADLGDQHVGPAELSRLHCGICPKSRKKPARP